MKNEKIRNLVNLVKSTILRNKGKTLSIVAILILGLSSAITLTPVLGVTQYGQNPNAGVVTQSATVPQQVVNFAGGVQIVEPTAAQIATYSSDHGPSGQPFQQVAPDMVFTVSPDPIGVGQTEQVIFGLWNIPAVLTGTFNGINTGEYGGWGAFQIIATAPNGTQSVNVGPPNTLTASSGASTLTFVPDTAGVWSVTCNWLGELDVNTTLSTAPGATYNLYWTPMSVTLNFTVQQAPIAGFTEAPIPLRTQQWTMPICAENTAWNVLDGPWLYESYNASSKFNPYTYAPDSAHILWQWNCGPEMGGNVGGDYGPQDFKWYNTWGNNPYTQMGEWYVEAINGYLYYDIYSNTGTVIENYSAIQCRSITTGQVVWTVPGWEDAAQICNYRNENIKYPITMLWDMGGTSWFCYEGNTGREQFQISGAFAVGSGASNSIIQGPVYPFAATDNGFDGGGSLFVYQTGTNAYNNGTWIVKWDSNQFFQVVTAQNGEFIWPGTLAVGGTYPWVDGIDWNRTVINAPGASYKECGDALNGDTTLLMERGSSGSYTPVLINGVLTALPWTTLMWAVDQNDGSLIWSSSFTAPSYSDWGAEPVNLQEVQSGVFTTWAPDNGSVVGFSEYTGKQVWITQITTNSYGNIAINANYGFESQIGVVGYGNLYIAPEANGMICVNMATGAKEWTFNTLPGGLIVPEIQFPIASNQGYQNMPCLADGKLFFTTGKEHETNPYWQDEVLYCINATTGTLLWNETGDWGVEVIADGMLYGVNPYFGTAGVIARGPTQTTVTAPNTAIAVGTPCELRGTILDQSPALLNTPAVSDACMSGWMAYKLMDQVEPSNAAGVPIVITAVDPNGNFIPIATVTSDVTGNFHYTWTPPDVPGTYVITATMDATNSYYGSNAETSAVVVGAAPSSAAPTATPTSVADMYFVPAIAGLFVLIIVVAIVLALLMLRKRP